MARSYLPAGYRDRTRGPSGAPQVPPAASGSAPAYWTRRTVRAADQSRSRP